jgi:hypothetical protein
LFKWLWLSLPLPNRLHRCSLSVRSRRWFRVLLRPKSLSWVIIIYNTCIALIFIYIELIIRINSWCNNRGDLVSLLIYNNTTKLYINLYILLSYDVVLNINVHKFKRKFKNMVTIMV